MKIAALPADEDLRLLDLQSYEILDTAPEREFDELVQLASQVCDCPISIITFVDSDRQWFKAKVGLPVDQTSRNAAFCAHTILQETPMVVENALDDDRFHDNPLVKGDPNIRFYAGAPIISPTGHKMGSICVIDNKPNKLNAIQENVLNIISSQITKLMELRRANMLLRRRASDLLDLNNHTIQEAIKQKDESDKIVAAELHEQIAQKVATCNLYMNMLEGDDAELRGNAIGWVKDTMGEIIGDIRSLTNSLVPTTLGSAPLRMLLADYVEKVSSLYEFKITTRLTGGIDKLNLANSVSCFRIIEKWMGVLAKQGDVSKVTISINAGHVIDLNIMDDGCTRNFEDMERHLVTSTVYSRVNMARGTITYHTLKKCENVLLVKMP